MEKNPKTKQQNRLVFQSSISYHISILCSSLDLFLKHMLPQHDRAPDLPDPKPCTGRDLQLQDGSSGLFRLQFSFSAAAGAQLQLGCTAAAWKQGWRHWKGALHCLERIKPSQESLARGQDQCQQTDNVVLFCRP